MSKLNDNLSAATAIFSVGLAEAATDEILHPMSSLRAGLPAPLDATANGVQ